MPAENFLVDQISAGSLGEGPVALEQLTRQAGCTGKSPLLQRFALSGRETVQVAVDVLAAAFRPGFGSLLRPALGLLLPAAILVALALPLVFFSFGPSALALRHIGGGEPKSCSMARRNRPAGFLGRSPVSRGNPG